MKLTTSRNNEYNVNWIDSTRDDVLVLEMDDARKLAVIAAEFEDLEWLKRESEEQGNKEWQGYSELESISRVRNGAVLLRMKKPEGVNTNG